MAAMELQELQLDTKIIKMGSLPRMVRSISLRTSHPGTAFEARYSIDAVNIHRSLSNDINALESKLKWNRIRGGTAAVFLEPVGPESGTRPVDKDYNKQVRELCDKYGALLVFDEVVTGFRLGLGGAQGYFGVVPDLTIFGKIIAGGYPGAGGVGGKKEYVGLCAAGVQAGKKRAYVGGTLSANPLSCVAGYYCITEIERTNACVKAMKSRR